MKFANPYFLFALGALAIPILIHLFNFRRFKRVYFTNVRFLKEVRQDTQARNKLKHLLILISRLLAVSFLVFAFAQPYIPKANAVVHTGQKAVSIYIDNSFSMDAIGKNGTLLDEAKKDAQEIVAAYKPSDRFQLLTNDFEGRHQRFVNREEFLDLLDEVKQSPAVRKISEVVQRQEDMLNSAGAATGNKNSFLIGDFQQSTSDFAAVKSDTTIRFHLVPLTAQNRNNIYIDSVWFTSPVHLLNMQDELHIRIKSCSSQSMENVPLRLYINGQAKTPSTFSIAANGVTDTLVYFTTREPGLQQGLLSINDYPVTFDDKFYFTFTVLKSIPVLSIDASQNGGGTTSSENYVKEYFASDTTFAFTSADEKTIDYGSFSNYRFIVLNGLQSVSSGLSAELKKFVDNGGSIFVFPGDNADLQSYHDFLSPMHVNPFEKYDTAKTVVDRLNFSHPLYKGVFEKTTGNLDLPVVYHHYRIGNATATTQEELMRLRNGDVFAASYSPGKGRVYLCAVPLLDSYSNFPRHAVVVPTLYQAAMLSEPQNEMFYTIGNDADIVMTDATVTGDQVFHIADPTKNVDIIPAQNVVNGRTALDVHRQVKDPGNYFVKSGNDIVTGVSFNYDRKESDLATMSTAAIAAALENGALKNFVVMDNNHKGLTDSLTEIDFGTRLWKTCTWLALFFLLAEILLVRFWKTGIKSSTLKAAS